MAGGGHGHGGGGGSINVGTIAILAVIGLVVANWYSEKEDIADRREARRAIAVAKADEKAAKAREAAGLPPAPKVIMVDRDSDIGKVISGRSLAQELEEELRLKLQRDAAKRKPKPEEDI